MQRRRYVLLPALLLIIGIVAQFSEGTDLTTVSAVEAHADNDCPSVTISPSSAPPGATITARGTCWNPARRVQVVFPVDQVVAEASVNSQTGSFSVSFTVPQTVVREIPFIEFRATDAPLDFMTYFTVQTPTPQARNSSISITVDRGDGSTYRTGEQVSVCINPRFTTTGGYQYTAVITDSNQTTLFNDTIAPLHRCLPFTVGPPAGRQTYTVMLSELGPGNNAARQVATASVSILVTAIATPTPTPRVEPSPTRETSIPFGVDFAPVGARVGDVVIVRSWIPQDQPYTVMRLFVDCGEINPREGGSSMTASWNTLGCSANAHTIAIQARTREDSTWSRSVGTTRGYRLAPATEQEVPATPTTIAEPPGSVVAPPLESTPLPMIDPEPTRAIPTPPTESSTVSAPAATSPSAETVVRLVLLLGDGFDDVLGYLTNTLRLSPDEAWRRIETLAVLPPCLASDASACLLAVWDEMQQWSEPPLQS